MSSDKFLYTLPQNEGYEFFVGQWAGHELPDLQKDKGIVLLTAKMDGKFVTVHQAQCLANQVQLFYGLQRLETFRLVKTFNHKPAEFKHMSVIAELEESGIGPAVTTN